MNNVVHITNTRFDRSLMLFIGPAKRKNIHAGLAVSGNCQEGPCKGRRV